MTFIFGDISFIPLDKSFRYVFNFGRGRIFKDDMYRQ